MKTVKVGEKTFEYDGEVYTAVEQSGEEDSAPYIFGTNKVVLLAKGREFQHPIYIGDRASTEGLIFVTLHVFLIRTCDIAAVEV